MTNRLCLYAIVLCIAAAIAGAATAAEAPAETAAPAVSLEALFGKSACARGVKEVGINPVQQSCSAQADCGGWTISCNESGSGSCQGVDRNCPGEQGHVTCAGSTTWCPDPCPDPCNVEACTVGCSVHADCNAVCCGAGFCANGGCSPKPYIKFCICA